MSDKSGGPAFPRTGHFDEHGPSESDSTSQDGMTLRQWYAGLAMQGWLSSWPATQWPRIESTSELAEKCFDIADALIAAEQEKSS